MGTGKTAAARKETAKTRNNKSWRICYVHGEGLSLLGT